jgi:hypothetical protein
VKSLTCAEQFRVMAFAQLTYRESLRDIEVGTPTHSPWPTRSEIHQGRLICHGMRTTMRL